MAYSELIKKFENIRDYMREFYVYGFKSREEFDKKVPEHMIMRNAESKVILEIIWGFIKPQRERMYFCPLTAAVWSTILFIKH